MKISLAPLGRIALLAAASVAAPAAYAADGSLNTAPIQNLFDSVLTILNTVIVPLVFAIAFIVFLWGVFNYFIAGGANEEKRSEGAKFVLWSIIGFAVMISVWGLVNILVTTFGFNSQTRPCLPTFSGPCVEGTSASNSGVNDGEGNVLNSPEMFY